MINQSSLADVGAQRGYVKTRWCLPGLFMCLGRRQWYPIKDKLGMWANLPSSKESGTPQVTSGSIILMPILVTQSKSSILLVDLPWPSLDLHFWKGYAILGLDMWILTHSSTLAWEISWTEEAGRLQSMGSLRIAWLSDFSFTFHFHALEKEMATHSSILAWRIPGTGEPGGLPSMGSHRVKQLSSSSMWILWQQWEWCSLSMAGERTWSHPWNICLISYHWGCVSYNQPPQDQLYLYCYPSLVYSRIQAQSKTYTVS